MPKQHEIQTTIKNEEENDEDPIKDLIHEAMNGESNDIQLNFAIPDPTVPEVRQYRTGVVGPDFFSFILFLILSNNTEFAINEKFGNNR